MNEKKKFLIICMFIALISCGGGGGGGGSTTTSTTTPTTPVESAYDSNWNIRWNSTELTYNKNNPHNKTSATTQTGSGVTVGVLDM